MEIVLLERVEKLGQMGDIVTVKAGFARNYLLPQKKALRATKANMVRFETERAQLETQNLEQKKEAEAVAGKLDGLTVTLIRQASESTMLYGSVNSRDIAEAVTAAGFTTDRKQIVLDRVLKNLGLHSLVVRLHPEVSVTVTVNIARSDEEAESQARGEAIGMEAEEAAAEAEAAEETAAAAAEAEAAAEAGEEEEQA